MDTRAWSVDTRRGLCVCGRGLHGRGVVCMYGGVAFAGAWLKHVRLIKGGVAWSAEQYRASSNTVSRNVEVQSWTQHL